METFKREKGARLRALLPISAEIHDSRTASLLHSYSRLTADKPDRVTSVCYDRRPLARPSGTYRES